MKRCALRMFRQIKILVIVAGALFALVACQDTHHSEQNPSGTVTVKIPAYENGSYKLRAVDLTTLTDMKLLKGEAAHFLFSPSFQDGKLAGAEPRVHLMRTSDGTYVAEDAMSLHLLSLYANFEGLMKMDERLGIKGLNNWPRPIGVNAKVSDGKGNLSRDNARFSGQLDAFLFEPFSLADLPLAVNGGVIGHEHFHSIFYKLVLEKIGGQFARASSDPHDTRGMAKEMGLTGLDIDSTVDGPLSERDLYHLTLFRGINEGFADIWGWAYSGDTNFVARSIRSETQRDLDLEADNLPSTGALEAELANFATQSETLSKSYSIGTLYAQIFRRVVEAARVGDGAKSGETEASLRMKLAEAMLKALPKIAADFSALEDSKKYSPGRVVELLANEIPFLNQEACDLLKAKLVRNPEAKVCTGQTGSKP